MSQVVNKNIKLGDLKNMHPEWFTQLLAVRMRNTVKDRANALSRISSLMREQSASNIPFDWDEELTHFEAKQPTDIQRWEPTMGTPNDNFVSGIAASDLANGGDGHHYVVVHTCDVNASQRLHAYFNKHPQMSVAEFINSAPYRMTRAYQERNARRVAARIGAALDPETPAHKIIDVEEDRRSARQGADNLRPELMAKPTYHVVYNCFDHNNLMPAIGSAFYGRGTLYRPAEANIHQQSTVLKVLDPATGFLLRRCNPNRDQVEPIEAAYSYDKKEDNPEYMKKKNSNRLALKQHVQSCYLNRQGETPSSASRPLWQKSSTEEIKEGDVKLTPVVFIIHGARAASV